MPSAADWHRILLLEVGAGLDGSDPVERAALDKVTPNIDLLWTLWSDKALIHPRLQYLYVKRQALTLLTGQLRDLVNVSIGGFNQNQQQRLDTLFKMVQAVDADIKQLEIVNRASRAPVIGQLQAQYPREPAPTQVDPNNPSLRGDALIRPVLEDPLGWQQSTAT